MTLDRDVRSAIIVPGVEGGTPVGAEYLALYNPDGSPVDARPEGPEGPIGPAGADGADGATGPAGPTGPAGVEDLTAEASYAAGQHVEWRRTGAGAVVAELGAMDGADAGSAPNKLFVKALPNSGNSEVDIQAEGSDGGIAVLRISNYDSDPTGGRSISFIVDSDVPGEEVYQKILIQSDGFSDFTVNSRSSEVIDMEGIVADGEWGDEYAVLNLAHAYKIYRIVSDKAARIRLYTSQAARDADLARPIGTDPEGDHGCLLDFVTTDGDLDWALSPVVDGYTLDGSALVWFAVQNLGATTDNEVTLYTMI